MAMPKKIAVVGSSHVSWWQHAIATRQLPPPNVDITFIGRGATPIWGDFIRTGIANIEQEVDQVFMLLGDFRHGNRVLKSTQFLKSGAISGNFQNIDKALISDENDKILLTLIVKRLQELRERLGSKLRILFWSLTFREFQSLESGRYGGRENYHHPVWNLCDLIDQFRDVAIDTTPLTRLPIQSLFIDASGHPNIKGHALLYRLLSGESALTAYESVCHDFNQNSPLLFPPHVSNCKLTITGDSIALNALEKAARTHYFILPNHWEVSFVNDLKSCASVSDKTIYLSGLHFQDENIQQINAKIAETKTAIDSLNLSQALTLVFWDQWAREIVSTRPEYNGQFLPKNTEAYVEPIEQAFAAYEVIRLSSIPLDEANGMVEFGGSFTPSGKGYAVLFQLMLSDTALSLGLSRYQEFAAHCLKLNPIQAHVVTEAVFASPSLHACFEGVNSEGHFSGWAIDQARPERPIPVYLFAGEQWLASVLADEYRADLDKGYCGFSANPVLLSQLRDFSLGLAIHAYFDQARQFELPNSPIKLDQEALTNLSLATMTAWRDHFHLAAQSADEGRGGFIANKVPLIKDPSIYPHADVVLHSAVIEQVKRLPAFLKTIVRARVIGGVYRADKQLELSALGHSALGLFQLADKQLTTKPARHLDGEYIYGGMLLDHYGHFLIEGLARAHAFQRLAALPIVYTLPYSDMSEPDKLPSYAKAIFELLGIALDRLILIQETTSCEQLVIPKIGMRWWDYLDSKHQQIIAAQVKVSLDADYPRTQHGSLYLSRAKLNTNHDGHVICGETVFEDYLRAEGVTVISPEKLPVREQVRLLCASENVIGFVGSAFHTLLLCADTPAKIFYLNRKKAAVNPQYPLIDKVLNINGHYIDAVVRNSARIALVDFEMVSRSLLAAGIVSKPFDAHQTELNTEFLLLNDWLDIKKQARRLTLQHKKRLESIIQHCLNPVVVEEAQTLLGSRG